MWDRPQYTSGERAFSLFRDTSETSGVKAEARAGAWASKIVLKICCKSSSEYLGTSVVETIVTGGFALKDPAGYSENSDSGSGEESWGATKGVTEGVTEGCSR